MIEVEHAGAIRAFDYFAAASFGAVAAIVASYVVPATLPMPLAMIGGMVIGTISAIPLLGLFTYLLGGFEIVVMSAQIGMVAGMVGASGGVATVGGIALVGACVGIGVQLVLHVIDARLRGEVRGP